MKPRFPPFDYKDPQAIARRLQELLPTAHFVAVQEVMLVAEQNTSPALLVGGIVRDLLLGRENLDLDFVTLDFSHHLAEKLVEHFKEHPEISRVKLLKHERFGTARLDLIFNTGEDLHIDLATARRETYAHPAALPTVEIDPPAPIEVDLKRRDFTINAMALSLKEGLVDPYGGLQDLRDGWLRVIHPGSFTDDPTRIVRGVRYAARFDYQFEPETERELQETVAAGTFKLLSAERKRNELNRILGEIAPDRALKLLRKYDLLESTHPLLVWDCETLKEFKFLKERRPSAVAYLSALCWQRTPEQVQIIVNDLNFFDEEAGIPPQVARLRHETLPELNESLSNSRLYALLHKYDPEALEIAAVLLPEKEACLRKYLDVVSQLKPVLGGDYLKELGLVPGKHFRVILDKLRDEVLDGKLQTWEEEAEFLKAQVNRYQSDFLPDS